MLPNPSERTFAPATRIIPSVSKEVPVVDRPVKLISPEEIDCINPLSVILIPQLLDPVPFPVPFIVIPPESEVTDTLPIHIP